MFPQEIADRYHCDDAAVLASGESSLAVEQTRLLDGSIGWIERVKSPVRSVSGENLGIQVLFWDVTDRIKAEEAMRLEQSLLRTLLENIPDSIYFKDRESRFVRVSQALAEKFGRKSPDDVHGRTDADIFTPEHAMAAREDEIEIIKTGRPLVDRVERETWPDQEDTWCLTTKMPLRDEDGKTIGTFGISRDITELKRSEAALREAVRMADLANRAKSEFLANMSHEIRTPLNAIVGMADLLAQTKLADDQNECVDTIRKSSDALLHVINDILDFSKIEAKRMELESVPFSLPYEIQAALSTLRLQAGEKGLSLKFEIDSDLPSTFMGDPGRLRQILINLLSNAVKFTDNGGVKITMHRLGENSSEGIPIRISVVDTGIGIAPENQDKILAPFTQADASMTRRFGGTGLGLSITRQLVDLMGGTLKVRSEPGQGSTFYFDLVLEQAAEIIEKDYSDSEDDLIIEGSSHLSPLRVLVAEDGVTNQHVISGLLRSLGHECAIASDGREVLTRWRNEAFDVVLMDMHMPVMDGLEATRAIRQEEYGTDRHVPIIALTAAAMAEDAAACRRAGMDDYLTKPIRRRQLQQILTAYQRPLNEGSTEATMLTEHGTVIEQRPRDARSPRGSATVEALEGHDSSDILRLSDEHAGCLDLDSARSRIPGGASGVMRLTAVFRSECAQLVESLNAELIDRNFDAARRTAHTLKGACGLLGAKQLGTTAQTIEFAARDGQLEDEQEMQALLSCLREEAGQVLGACDELLSRR